MKKGKKKSDLQLPKGFNPALLTDLICKHPQADWICGIEGLTQLDYAEMQLSLRKLKIIKAKAIGHYTSHVKHDLQLDITASI
jgi:hypothetical protein